MEWGLHVPESSPANFMAGNQFLSVVVVHNRQAYSILGNGVVDHFLVEKYRRIASSLVFLHRGCHTVF